MERNFNTFEVEGLEPDVFEKAMAEFESELAPALERIIAAQSLQQNSDDYGIMLNFVTLLALKNPRQREMVRHFHDRVAKKIMNVAVSTPERWAHQVKKATEAGFFKADADTSYATMKKFIEDGHYTVAVSNERQISLEATTFDKLLPHIFRRGWALLKAPHDSGGFITRDRHCAAFAERQVYARDYHFRYTFQKDEPSRKASKLITDPKFLHRTYEADAE